MFVPGGGYMDLSIFLSIMLLSLESGACRINYSSCRRHRETAVRNWKKIAVKQATHDSTSTRRERDERTRSKTSGVLLFAVPVGLTTYSYFNTTTEREREKLACPLSQKESLARRTGSISC